MSNVPSMSHEFDLPSFDKLVSGSDSIVTDLPHPSTAIDETFLTEWASSHASSKLDVTDFSLKAFEEGLVAKFGESWRLQSDSTDED